MSNKMQLLPIEELARVSQKRSSPCSCEANDRPSKAAKVTDVDPLAVAEARIADLENQVKELHDFLDINRLATGSSCIL